MQASSASARSLSILGYVLMSGGMLALYGLRALLAYGPIALALQCAAVVLMVWARLTLGGRSFNVPAAPTAGALVTHGPYAYLRHPIYAALLYFDLMGALTHARPATLAAVAAVGAGMWIRISLEEQLLRRDFPGYAAYAAATPSVIPIRLAGAIL